MRTKATDPAIGEPNYPFILSNGIPESISMNAVQAEN